jgi:hypothetical protein
VRYCSLSWVAGRAKAWFYSGMRKASIIFWLVSLSTLLVPQTIPQVPRPANQRYLYKVTFIQAAPGKLTELIDLQKGRMDRLSGVANDVFWMRHSQGDRWDLMIMASMESYEDYYKPERTRARNSAKHPDAQKFHDDIAWQEDLFVYGPSREEVAKNWDGSGFFHVEIFQSLPGKQADLFKEREMENAYLRYLKQPTNLVFTRDQGAAWDCFTIGFYRDLQHYAESAKTTPEDADKAAKAAGFESAKAIGPYLRTLIALHHDTLAVAVK